MLLLVTSTSAVLRARFRTYPDAYLKRFFLREISCTENIIYEGLKEPYII